MYRLSSLPDQLLYLIRYCSVAVLILYRFGASVTHMIILVGHRKGGGGKSTLCVQLAAELQRLGIDVVIIDADPTVTTTSNWAADRKGSGKPEIRYVKHTGLLHELIHNLAGRHEVVLVDAAGKDSPELRSAMAVADVLLSPVQPTQVDLDATAGLAASVEEARKLNSGLKALIVLNRASTHPQDTAVAEAKAYLDDYPELQRTETVIHERKTYQKSIEDGGSAVESRNPKAKAEIQLLTQEVLNA